MVGSPCCHKPKAMLGRWRPAMEESAMSAMATSPLSSRQRRQRQQEELGSTCAGRPWQGLPGHSCHPGPPGLNHCPLAGHQVQWARKILTHCHLVLQQKNIQQKGPKFKEKN